MDGAAKCSYLIIWLRNSSELHIEEKLQEQLNKFETMEDFKVLYSVGCSLSLNYCGNLLTCYLS